MEGGDLQWVPESFLGLIVHGRSQKISRLGGCFRGDCEMESLY